MCVCFTIVRRRFECALASDENNTVQVVEIEVPLIEKLLSSAAESSPLWKMMLMYPFGYFVFHVAVERFTA